MASKGKHEADELVQILALEIASELALHYEDDEFWMLSKTMENIGKAKQYMETNHIPVPQIVHDVLKTYYERQN